jgi:hypothetical protein
MKTSILAVATAVLITGCGGPSTSKTPATPSAAMPTMITRAATEYGEIELAAVVRIEAGKVTLFSPNGEPYTGEMPDRFTMENLEMMQDLSAGKQQVGLCFKYPMEFPGISSGPEVFIDGKSASYARLGQRLDSEAPGRFAFALVDGAFDGRAFTVRIPVKPERVVGKGAFPLDGTVSVAGFGGLSRVQQNDEGARPALHLDLNNSYPEEHFELRVYNAEGVQLEVLGSGSQLNSDGYPVSYWWRVPLLDAAKTFEVWMGEAISVEFSGVILK